MRKEMDPEMICDGSSTLDIPFYIYKLQKYYATYTKQFRQTVATNSLTYNSNRSLYSVFHSKYILYGMLANVTTTTASFIRKEHSLQMVHSSFKNT